MVQMASLGVALNTIHVAHCVVNTSSSVMVGDVVVVEFDDDDDGVHSLFDRGGR